MSDLLNNILAGLGGAANFYLGSENVQNVKDIGQDIYGAATDLGTQAYDASQFEPFTVTSSTGGGTFDPNSGNINIGLSPGMQASANYGLGLAGDLAGRATDPNFVENRALQALGFMGTGTPISGAAGSASSIFGNLGIPSNLPPGVNANDVLGLMNPGTSRDEQSIYNMLEGMQLPGRERQNLELENRLFGQGRLGVQTDAYGGTPEQLALAKAQEEAKASNAFNAYRMAQEEAFRNRSATADEVSKAFGLGLTSRGQDISQSDILGRLGLGAYDRALSERGQDIGFQDTQANQALNAYRTALQEQGLLTDQTSTLAGLSFLPQEMLLRELGLGLDAAQIAQTGRLGGAELATGLAGTGLDALVNSESIAAALQANLNRDLTTLLSGQQGQQGLLSSIANIFSGSDALSGLTDQQLAAINL